MSTSVNHLESPSRTIARGQLAEYDRVRNEHAAADDRGMCEAFLELGIQVFHWIIKADHDYRRALYQHPDRHDQAAEQELEALMQGWLASGRGVLEWAEHNAAAGWKSSHLAEFRRCFEEAAAIIDSFDDVERGGVMTDPLILLRDQAHLEHQNGETSEFI